MSWGASSLLRRWLLRLLQACQLIAHGAADSQPAQQPAAGPDAGPDPSWAPTTDVGVAACQPGTSARLAGLPFCDASLAASARARDLLARINDTAKPALLTARGPGGKFDGNTEPNGGRQAFPDLGVPSFYWGSNCLHSAMLANCTEAGGCATSFPANVGWASTFDRTLMQQMATVVGEEQRAAFNLKFLDNGPNGLGLTCWGPVLNMNRDPRWGRNAEGGSECPFLTAAVGTSWTRGLQEGRGEETRFTQIAVTLKHFDANSLEGRSVGDPFTRYTVDANISKYLLTDYYWPAFRASIKDAGAKGIMCSYNAVNGKPTCLDPLMKAAREAWNFSGYVTSDSDSIAVAYTSHHYVDSAAAASCGGVKDGQCDIDSGNTYFHNLLDGVQQGLCTMADVDRAVYNTLKLRFDLGLFDDTADQPYWKLGAEALGSAESATLNLRAAQSSLVLLSNPRKLLPLKVGTKNIAMIGPHANATMALIQHDTGLICPGVWHRGHEDGGDNDPSSYHCVTSPYSAVREINIGGTTTYDQGCDIYDNSTDGFVAALASAKVADTIILGLGIEERQRKECGQECLLHYEREGHDRTSIDLPSVQKQLLATVIQLGKPTVVFLLNGGMLAVEDFITAPNVAVVEAFYPGMAGAKALAMSLFGQSNRWGRLPYTIYPASWAESNDILDHDVTHQRTYRYGAKAVLPFGHGLSLTKFSLAFAGEAEAGGVRRWLSTASENAEHNFTIAVRNTGDLQGDEVVQAYFIPTSVPGLKQHPQKALFGFQRLTDVQPGKTATATFTVRPDSLLLATEEGDRVREPGSFTLSFEDGSGEVLTAKLEISGVRVVVEPFPQP
jgi:beta-glucosidase-like glycosyl hydrolase